MGGIDDDAGEPATLERNTPESPELKPGLL